MTVTGLLYSPYKVSKQIVLGAPYKRYTNQKRNKPKMKPRALLVGTYVSFGFRAFGAEAFRSLGKVGLATGALSC